MEPDSNTPTRRLPRPYVDGGRRDSYPEPVQARAQAVGPAGVRSTYRDLCAGLAQLAEGRPEPIETTVRPAEASLTLMFGSVDEVRAWSAALGMGEPAVTADRTLGLIFTTAAAIVDGWSTTLRHIGTTPSGAHA